MIIDLCGSGNSSESLDDLDMGLSFESWSVSRLARGFMGPRYEVVGSFQG